MNRSAGCGCGRGPGRPMLKRQRPKPLFAKVKYCGPLPMTLVGQFSKRKYRWTAERPVLRVDRRDMPGLSEDAGRKNFEKAG